MGQIRFILCVSVDLKAVSLEHFTKTYDFSQLLGSKLTKMNTCFNMNISISVV